MSHSRSNDSGTRVVVKAVAERGNTLPNGGLSLSLEKGAHMSEEFGKLTAQLDSLRTVGSEVENLYRSDMASDSCMPSASEDKNADPVPAASAAISFVDHPRPSAGGSGSFDDILSTIKSMGRGLGSSSSPPMVRGASGAGPAGGLPQYKEGEDGPGEAAAIAAPMGAGDKSSGASALSSKSEWTKPIAFPSEADSEAGMGRISLSNEWDELDLRTGDDTGVMGRMQQGATNAGVFGEQDMPSMGSGSVSTVSHERPGMAKAKKKWTDARNPSRPDNFIPSRTGEKEYFANMYKSRLNKSVRLVFGEDGGVANVTAPVSLLHRVEAATNDETIAKSFAAQSPALGNYNATSPISRKNSCKHCGASKPAFITVCLACSR